MMASVTPTRSPAARMPPPATTTRLPRTLMTPVPTLRRDWIAVASASTMPTTMAFATKTRRLVTTTISTESAMQKRCTAAPTPERAITPRPPQQMTAPASTPLRDLTAMASAWTAPKNSQAAPTQRPSTTVLLPPSTMAAVSSSMPSGASARVTST